MIKLLANLTIGALTLIVVGGCSSPIDTGETPNNTEVLGVNIRKDIPDIKYQTPPKPEYFYGTLVVEPRILKNNFDEESSSELLRYFQKAFSNKSKQFSITLNPKVDSTNLPTIPLFSYTYKSKNNSWETKTSQVYYSPLIKMSNQTAFDYSVEFYDSQNTDLLISDAIESGLSLATHLNAGNWVISPLSEPIVNESVGILESQIEKQFGKSRSSQVEGSIRPAFNGLKSQTLVMLDGSDNKIAEVKISVLITNKILGSQISDDHLSKNVNNLVPIMDKHPDPLTSIRINGRDQRTIKEDLNSSINQLVNEDNPEQFAQTCHMILDNLQTKYALNYFDSINAMRFVLKPTNFTRFSGLYNSNCLSKSDFDLLAQMGVPLLPEFSSANDPLNKEQLDLIGNFSRSPVDYINAKDQLSSEFDNNLYLTIKNHNQSNEIPTTILRETGNEVREYDMTIDEFFAWLSQFRTARFGAYSGFEVINGEENDNVASFVARVRGSCAMTKIKLWSDPSTGVYEKIIVEPANKNDVPPSKWNDIQKKLDSNDGKYPTNFIDQDAVECSQLAHRPTAEYTLSRATDQ